MDLIVTSEQRFDRTPDGRVWTTTGFDRRFWARYLAVFDHAVIVARVRDVAAAREGARQVDGEDISVAPVPHYIGPEEYLHRAARVRRSARDAVGAGDAVIMRVPSQIALCLAPFLRRTGRPFALEVVGDPYDVFAPGGVRHPLRSIFRWWFPRRLRRLCGRACAVAYVTEAALQRRYLPSSEAFTTSYSSVDLPDDAFVQMPRRAFRQSGTFTVVTVASLAQLYKAPDVLIDAAAICVHGGLDLTLVVIGDGKHKAELKDRSERRGLEGRVQFLGELPAGRAVRDELDKADLFVLPSRTEGLPRAMIEAMARGLPCIGSTVGGIPELLASEDMVPPNNAETLAAKIQRIVSDPHRMMKMSTRNLERAREYCDATLRSRRVAFYRYIRERTQEWIIRVTRQPEAPLLTQRIRRGDNECL